MFCDTIGGRPVALQRRFRKGPRLTDPGIGSKNAGTAAAYLNAFNLTKEEYQAADAALTNEATAVPADLNKSDGRRDGGVRARRFRAVIIHQGDAGSR